MVDSLPAAMPNGAADGFVTGFPVGLQEQGRYYFYNHLSFHFFYHKVEESSAGDAALAGCARCIRRCSRCFRTFGRLGIGRGSFGRCSARPLPTTPPKPCHPPPLGRRSMTRRDGVEASEVYRVILFEVRRHGKAAADRKAVRCARLQEVHSSVWLLVDRKARSIVAQPAFGSVP